MQTGCWRKSRTDFILETQIEFDISPKEKAKNKEQLYKLLKEQYGTLPDYPWAEDPSAVFRHCHNRKWFVLHMQIPESKLELRSEHLTGEK